MRFPSFGILTVSAIMVVFGSRVHPIPGAVLSREQAHRIVGFHTDPDPLCVEDPTLLLKQTGNGCRGAAIFDNCPGAQAGCAGRACAPNGCTSVPTSWTVAGGGAPKLVKDVECRDFSTLPEFDCNGENGACVCDPLSPKFGPQPRCPLGNRWRVSCAG